MTPDLILRKKTHFVFWRPGVVSSPPLLVIGTYQDGTPPTLKQHAAVPLTQSEISPELFEMAAADCGLIDGQTYHYWFELTDTDPYCPRLCKLRITDPTAGSVDWRLTFEFPEPYQCNDSTPTENHSPAAVVGYTNGQLFLADALSQPNSFDITPDVASSSLPPNNRLVIYELPTAWTKAGDLPTAKNVGIGTFNDVRALVVLEYPGETFATVPAVAAGQHLIDLGINALELLPPADTYLDRRSWGYGTSNYFSPDFDLGRAADDPAAASTAVSDLLELVRACHARGIRFFYDAVMAFSKQDAYRFANFHDYHVQWGTDDPELGSRDGFGGDLWKYNWQCHAYDPVTGGVGPTFPARRHMIAHLLHWMNYYHIDGLRLDSVNNYGNWDFAGEIRDTARAAWSSRWAAEHQPDRGADARFLVIGEELSVPKPLLNRIDSLWNEDFKRILRRVVLGQNADCDPSFEWSVRKMIDCRILGFVDQSQAVNYIGSHDVGGFGNERFYNYLDHNGVVFKDRQIRLAFACLLTAVGVPMILAGDEFAGQSNFPQVTDANKEIDPINFGDLAQPWRADVFQYVARLVKLRTTADALSVNDTTFIHADFTDGKRVLVWSRGRPGLDDPVVVVANFSDWGTANPTNPTAEYVVPNWPIIPHTHRWREVTQSREVPPTWVGREPVYPWEAKVYTCQPVPTTE